ncbi:MAG: HlyC/CorC family transporter [Chloroflexi bacterium]|nr:HlyC/CorC family transporter [Chloroflexota bacterium]
MSDSRLIVFVVAALVLLFAAAAQAALVYIDRARLRHLLEEGTSRARALQAVVDEPATTLSTILLVYTSALFVAAGVCFWAALDEWRQSSPELAVAIAVVGLLVLLLVQILGRILALARPTQVALAIVTPVGVLGRVLFFVLVPLEALQHVLAGLLGARHELTPAEAEDRLRHLVEDNSDLEEEEREMIASVIELGEQPVREAMVPRIDIVAEPAGSTVREILDRIIDSGHSRIPIYEATVDNIVGVVYAKDLLKYLRDGSPDQPAAPLAREPTYVPETKKVDELLREMQQRHVHVAIVVDEYGGTAGLITIEDMIEEIVGEIQDEYDVEETMIEELSDHEALFDARVSIRDVNDTLDLDLSDDDFDTVGGLVYHELGKVPTVGDEIHVDGALVQVLATNGRRVKKVRVTKPKPPTAAAAEHG